MDHGTEFALVTSVQQGLSNFRGNPHRHPVLQSMSRQNHRAERIWPEINSRINYPVKRVLTRLAQLALKVGGTLLAPLAHS